MQSSDSNLTPGKGSEHDGGGSSKLSDAEKLSQPETSILRDHTPIDTGILPVGSETPYREQQLKQMRAQCLVFLAFRNGLLPKKTHLETALGSGFLREGNRAEE